MVTQEEKEKAEKLAAAKKRVAQLQKAKKKAASGEKAAPKDSLNKDEPSEQSTKAPPPTSEATSQKGVTEDTIPPEEQDADESAFNDAIKAATSSQKASTGDSADAGKSAEEGPLTPTGEDSVTTPTARSQHGRQPSLSFQSKIRSTSFRRTSTNGPLSPSIALAGPGDFPPLTPDGDTLPDIYRKQALRLDELERENKRLEKEARDYEASWRKSEEELEELREASSEAEALKIQAKKAADGEAEIARLRSELATLQRQNLQRGHSHSVSKSARSGSIPEVARGSPDSWRQELESKESTIADMELEMSRLRSQLSSQTQGCETHGEQIAALQQSLHTSQTHLRSVETELADVRKALQRASEKAVLDGTERTSKETKIRTLERELAEAIATREEVVKKAEKLEKKIEAMNKLHRETEARNSSRLAAAEAQGREAGLLKARLAAAENENLKLREERDRRKKREISGGGADEGLDELEDEARSKLEKKIRELEGENFDLKRGVWREKRIDMQPRVADVDDEGREIPGGEGFDEVDLSGHAPGRSQPGASDSHGQKHSSFQTVISSGLAAFRAATTSPTHQQTRQRQDSLLEEFDDDNGGAGFDEEAFARAQREEEAKKMVEHVREVKRKLKEWEGWRLDLVDVRRMGNGFGIGEIFDV